MNMKIKLWIGFSLVVCALGCGYGKTACTVIDAAEQACTIVRFLGPDGKEHTVKLSPEDLTSLGRQKLAAGVQEEEK